MNVINLPNPAAPAPGDTYKTSIGTIVVFSVWANGDVWYYLNGGQNASRHFALMLRSIEDVTPMAKDTSEVSGRD